MNIMNSKARNKCDNDSFEFIIQIITAALLMAFIAENCTHSIVLNCSSKMKYSTKVQFEHQLPKISATILINTEN